MGDQIVVKPERKMNGLSPTRAVCRVFILPLLVDPHLCPCRSLAGPECGRHRGRAADLWARIRLGALRCPTRERLLLASFSIRFWFAEPGPPLQSAIRETWQRTIAAQEANPDAELPFETP